MAQSGYGGSQRKRTNIDRIPLIMLLILLGGIILMDKIMVLRLNWVDYTIIGIVFFCAFVGYVRGLISTVFSLVGYIVAVICAVLFSEPVAMLIMQKTQISRKVEEALVNAYSSIPAFSQQTLDFSIQNSNEIFESYPQLKEFLNDNLLFSQLFDSVNPLASGAQAISDAVANLSDLLVFSILKVISVIAIFLIVKIIVIIIGSLVNSLISQSSILSTTNKTIGLALGTIIGCFIVFITVSYIIPFIGSLNIIQMPDEYSKSRVINWIFSSPLSA
jgi:uncharacterized membrane protein required for colicin V production